MEAFGQDRVIEDLQDQIAVLKDRIAAMESEIFCPDLVEVEWGLTATEARIFAVLVKKKIATKKALELAAWPYEATPPDDPNIIESHVSKMRKKMRKFGILIHSRRFDGYWIDPAARESLLLKLKLEAA